MSDRYFDISPEQYHAGLDKLWTAIGGHDPKGRDVFTAVNDCIIKLEAELAIYRRDHDAMEALRQNCYALMYINAHDVEIGIEDTPGWYVIQEGSIPDGDAYPDPADAVLAAKEDAT